MEEQMDILVHSGVAHDENPPGRGSGRWPWGSGDKPFQRPKDFLQQVYRLESMGLSEMEQAQSLGIFTRDKRKPEGTGSPSRLRYAIRVAQHEEKLDLIRQCQALAKEGLGPTEIAKQLDIPNESSVRGYLKEGAENRAAAAIITANDLRKIVDEKGPIYVGEGVSHQLNISEDRFKEALEILYFDGYEIRNGRVPQPTNPSHMTTTTVLAPPGTPESIAYKPSEINFIQNDYVSMDGKTLEKGFQYPTSLDSSRLMARYPSEGGAEKDGLVELRPGVKDIYLGDGVNYSQVRILVDGTHYIKGMAAYGDPKDFPPGIDLIFNTSKPDGTPLKNSDPNGKQVLKDIGKDPNNPFESTIKEHGGQSYWEDENGEKHLSLINKRADEGDWGEWSKKLPSQFLSKQPMKFINRQLDISKKDARKELDDILALTNNDVKKYLLDKYADTIDGQATDLSAASVNGQMYQVLLPINSLKDNEVYAPNYHDGDILSLVRFPHAGTFEIATLVVNNNNPEADRMITKHAKDAVGINANNLKKLSGADCDGDTVMVLPHYGDVSIKSDPILPGLKSFDIELEYGDHPGNVHMKKGQQQQLQMGIVSNLITDMTAAGAPNEHLEMADKHSMVIIDAVKHKYDWKQSEIDNHIEELKALYQRKVDENGEIHIGGASTIISRAGGKLTKVGKRKEGELRTDPTTGKSKMVYIDPETGDKLYTIIDKPYRYYMDPNDRDENGKKRKEKDRRMFPTDTPGIYRSKDGKTVLPKESLVLSKEYHHHYDIPAMMDTNDAMTLVSADKHPVELAYARYANYLKDLSREARKEYDSLKGVKYDPQANKTYSTEVRSLNDKYIELEKKKPVEAQAIMEANTMIKAWYQDNPEATKEQAGKARQRITSYCRQKRGLNASENTLSITPKEWEAIQAGAISSSKLQKLLTRADMDVIREYATPKTGNRLTDAQISRIRSMHTNNKLSNAAIAEALGINVSTVIKYLDTDGAA